MDINFNMTSIIKYILLLLLLIILSCQSNEENCRYKIDEFISKSNENELEKLFGFTARSTWSKKDVFGNRRVPRISYTNSGGRLFELSSFQKYSDGTAEPFDTIELKNYLLDTKTVIRDVVEDTKRRTDKIVYYLNNYNIAEIQSQNHLGRYIEFTIELGCKVYYKKENEILKDGMKKAFDSAYKIGPNWYLLSGDTSSDNLISSYKESKIK